jgi:hypothetical protein
MWFLDRPSLSCKSAPLRQGSNHSLPRPPGPSCTPWALASGGVAPITAPELARSSVPLTTPPGGATDMPALPTGATITPALTLHGHCAARRRHDQSPRVRRAPPESRWARRVAHPRACHGSLACFPACQGASICSSLRLLLRAPRRLCSAASRLLIRGRVALVDDEVVDCSLIPGY